MVQNAPHAPLKRERDERRSERRMRERIESAGSAASGVPKTPKVHHKQRHFDFPDNVDKSHKEHTRRPRDHRESKKRRELAQSSDFPEAANKEFVYKDYRRDSKPGTPASTRHKKHRSRTGSVESRRKFSPGSQSLEGQISSGISKNTVPQPVEKLRKDKSRPSVDIGTKYVDSPTRKRHSLKQKRMVQPAVIVDMHGPDKDRHSDIIKKDSLPMEDLEEKDDEMHTIPMIKVSINYLC